jgi:hypothetical protein
MTLEQEVRIRMQAAEESVLHALQAFELQNVGDLTGCAAAARLAFLHGAVAGYILTLAAVLPDSEEECEARLKVLSEEVDGIIASGPTGSPRSQPKGSTR